MTINKGPRVGGPANRKMLEHDGEIFTFTESYMIATPRPIAIHTYRFWPETGQWVYQGETEPEPAAKATC